MEEQLSGSKRTGHESFAPREVSAHNPVDVTISKVGLGIVAASISLITISLVQSTQEDPSVELEKDNATIFLRENMEVIRNGSYNYGSNSEFAVIQSGVIDSWLTALDSGMIRYNYGDSINNFCWKRKEIPENEFLPSLFRSSQLFVGVQVLIRAAILFSLLHRILLLSATLCLYSRRRSMWFTTIPLAIINETLHVIAIFIVFTIHIGQDYQYSQTSAIALAIALVTFVMKMFLLSTIKEVCRNQFHGRCTMTLCRMGIAIVTIIIGRYIVENWKKFMTHNTCDQMVLSTVAISEWLFVLVMLASYVLDLIDGRSLYFTVDVFTEETCFNSSGPVLKVTVIED